jgi:hypothetical protein
MPRGHMSYMHMSRYMFVAEVIHLVEDGNIANMPTLTQEDVRRAYECMAAHWSLYEER